MRRRAQPWLGTMVEVALQADTPEPAAAFAAAFGVIAGVHRRMSPQLADSDVARFNSATAGSAIGCSQRTRVVLAAARELEQLSDGAFDVSLGSGGRLAWSLHEDRLVKHTDEVQLDLGGIAKGEAVDLACAALQDHGVRAGWVNAGGDLRVFGALDHAVHLRDPDDAARVLPLCELRDGACASSVFDRARYPRARHRSVSVAAPQCRWADALTKLIAFAPPLGPALLARYHARAWIDPF